MKDSDLSIAYPQLFHMANENAWENIQAHGLLSTTALLDKFDVTGTERERIKSMHRADSITITHPTHGSAVIRDQKPLHDSKLSRCLSDMNPAEWYLHLNRRVFFWTELERVNGLLNARAYRNSKHLLLTISTRKLLQNHADSITLCHKNSGQTRAIHPLGKDTFKSIKDWPPELNRNTGRLRKPVVEVCVDYAVPDIRELLVRAEIVTNLKVVKELFP